MRIALAVREFVRVAGHRVELADDDARIVREELNEGEIRDPEFFAGRQREELIGVDRHQSAGVAVHGVRPVSLDLEGEEAPGP